MFFILLLTFIYNYTKLFTFKRYLLIYIFNFIALDHRSFKIHVLFTDRATPLYVYFVFRSVNWNAFVSIHQTKLNFRRKTHLTQHLTPSETSSLHAPSISSLCHHLHSFILVFLGFPLSAKSALGSCLLSSFEAQIDFAFKFIDLRKNVVKSSLPQCPLEGATRAADRAAAYGAWSG